MLKSDKRTILTSDHLYGLKNDVQHFIKILLLEVRPHIKEAKDILFAYAMARASIMIQSIFDLWDKKHFSDCFILHRAQIDRLLTLYYIIDTDSVIDFDDWSFIQNYENRNKAKSDINYKHNLIPEFWIESRRRIERYQSLKKAGVSWKRPDGKSLEEIAKKHNLYELYKFGYSYASAYVHPLSSDGEVEFGLVTGIKPRNKVELDYTSILTNTMFVCTFLLKFALDESTFRWHDSVFKFVDESIKYIASGNSKHNEHLKLIEEIILHDYPIFKQPNSKTMTKAEIINQIVAQTGIAKPTVTATVEAIMDTINQSMVNGENVYLRGFGTFLMKKRAEKTGRNITKGTSVKIPAHFVPAFKPCKEFVGAVKTKVKMQ
jgi:DNA-binding protein HU-beta